MLRRCGGLGVCYLSATLDQKKDMLLVCQFVDGAEIVAHSQCVVIRDHLVCNCQLTAGFFKQVLEVEGRLT